MKKIFLAAAILLSCLQGFSLATLAWQSATLSTVSRLKAVYFLNSSEGWVVGSSKTVFKTTDGGISWSTVEVSAAPSGDDFNGVCFFNQTQGLIGGKSGRMYSTVNGGTSWTLSTLEALSGDILDLNRKNDTAALAITQKIWKTTNYGGDWTQMTNGLPGGGIEGGGIASGVADGINCIAVTRDGKAYYSTDHGNNWALGYNDGTTIFQDVYLTSTNVAYAVGKEGKIAKSSDGGQNWTLLTSPTTSHLYDAFFLDANTGWIVGYGGAAYSTTDGGQNWSSVSLPSGGATSSLEGVYATSTDFICFVGDDRASGRSAIFLYRNWDLSPSSVEVTVTNSIETAGLSWTAASDDVGLAGYEVKRAAVSGGRLLKFDDFSDGTLSADWLNSSTNGTFSFTESAGKMSATASITNNEGLGLCGISPPFTFESSRLYLVSVEADLASPANSVNAAAGPTLYFGGAIFPWGYILKSGSDTYLAKGQPRINIDPPVSGAAVISGEVTLLQGGDVASLFFNGNYIGKFASQISDTTLYPGIMIGNSLAGTNVEATFDNFTAVEFPVTTLATLSASTTTYTDTNLAIGETYYYYIQPLDTAGNRNGSNVVKIFISPTTTTTTSSSTTTTGSDSSTTTLTSATTTSTTSSPATSTSTTTTTLLSNLPIINPVITTPVPGGATLNLTFQLNEEKQIVIQILDSNLSLVAEKSLSGKAGVNEIELFRQIAEGKLKKGELYWGIIISDGTIQYKQSFIYLP